LGDLEKPISPSIDAAMAESSTDERADAAESFSLGVSQAGADHVF
jgi:hypothetical protein